MGLAVGWSAVVLSFGKKGWRKSLPHSLGALRGAHPGRLAHDRHRHPGGVVVIGRDDHGHGVSEDRLEIWPGNVHEGTLRPRRR